MSFTNPNATSGTIGASALTLGWTPAAGSLLRIRAKTSSGALTTGAAFISDSAGGTWSVEVAKVQVSGSGPIIVATYYKVAAGTETTVTFNPASGTGTFCVLNYGGFTGTPTLTGSQVGSAATPATGTTDTTPTIGAFTTPALVVAGQGSGSTAYSTVPTITFETTSPISLTVTDTEGTKFQADGWANVAANDSGGTANNTVTATWTGSSTKGVTLAAAYADVVSTATGSGFMVTI